MPEENNKEEIQESADSTGTYEAAADSNSPPELETTPLLEAIRQPIPGENRAGLDVTYDDDFQRIKSEIDRIGKVTAKVDQERAAADAKQLKKMTSKQHREMEKKRERGQAIDAKSMVGDKSGVDYPMIIDLTSRILTEKSKDLRVASYLCLALFREQGMAGMVEGLMTINILMQEYWDDLFPVKERMAVRKGAFDFLAYRLTEALEGTTIHTNDRSYLESSRALLAGLQKDLEVKIPDNPPSLFSLKKLVDDCLEKAIKSAHIESTPSDLKEEPDVTQLSSPAESMDTEVRSQQDAFDEIKKAALYLRVHDQKGVMSYRLLRIMRWDALITEPLNENGKTKIEPPPVQRRDYLLSLMQEGQWDKLLEEAEVSFTQPPFHFWFDLQRLTDAAMEALDGFHTVRMAVIGELAIFLRRLPGLPKLTFMDETPFADLETRDWIEETVMPVLEESESSASGFAPVADDELARRFDDAKSVLSREGLADAIAFLQDGAKLDLSRKTRFYQRLYMAMLCMRGNQPKMARPLLEELDREIEKYSIDEWEPSLALQVWTNLQKCHKLLSEDSSIQSEQQNKENAATVFDKICRLDVQHALAITDAKSKNPRTIHKRQTKKTSNEEGKETEEDNRAGEEN
jgi:type VI secretion system protein VasJ